MTLEFLAAPVVMAEGIPPPSLADPPPPTPPAASSVLPTKARIALFTVRSFAIEHALPVISNRPDAELACVLTTPGPKGRRSPAHLTVMEALHRLGHANVDVICSNKKSKWPDLLALYDVNLILVSGFPWLIPVAVLDDPRISLGVINFHNSHLPKFQGPNAFGHYMVSGEDSVGYCCHRMSAEFDTGPILFTETVPLDVNEDYQDLKVKMPTVFAGMVDKALTLALQGEPGTPQTGTPSHAPKFDDAFRWIDFRSSTARDVHNKVRAFYGERDHPKGALAALEDGTTICITKTRYHPAVTMLGMPPSLRTASGGPAGEDTDVDSLASLTSLSSEGMTSSTSSSNFVAGESSNGGGIGSFAGAASAGSHRGDNDAPFFVQCGDTTLEVLEWHRIEGLVRSVAVNVNVAPATTPKDEGVAMATAAPCAPRISA